MNSKQAPVTNSKETLSMTRRMETAATDEHGNRDESMPCPTSPYFLGFQRSVRFEEVWRRLETLDIWRELAIRPETLEACHPDDRFLLLRGNQDVDDLVALTKQCQVVRELLHKETKHLSIETTEREQELAVQPSQIEGAGMGLYYLPQQISGVSHAGEAIPAGSIVCFYTGHIHSHVSSRTLQDKSYLMWIRDDILVDPGPLSDTVLARYINDPLNEALVNCRYVPDDQVKVRSAVVATRPIQPGEELFASYGEFYWKQQPIEGKSLSKVSVDGCKGEVSER